jgi:hypothetical protein
MSSDVWAPATPSSRRDPSPGGEHPDVVGLLTDTWKDFSANLAGYAMLGVAAAVVMVPLAFLVVAVAIGPMMVGVATENEDLILLGMIPYVLGLLLGLPLINVPVQNGLYHAINRHLDGEEGTLGFGAFFSGMFTRVGAMLVFQYVLTAAALIGTMMCFLPGLLVQVVFSMATAALVVHRLGPFAALGRSSRHFQQDMKWHFGYWGLGWMVLMIASNLPIVGLVFGLPFAASYHLRGYRAVFGTDPDAD